MQIVLVRVTGRRTADEDPALAPLITNARRYVQQYRAAPDNKLWVAFDGAAIERWLTQNGQPLWGHERPSTVVWLAVQTGAQSGTVDHRGRCLRAQVGDRRGCRRARRPVLWPSAADVQRNHLDYAGLIGAAPGALADIGHRLGAEGTLIGRATGCDPCSRGALDLPVPGSQQRVFRVPWKASIGPPIPTPASSRSAARLVPVDIEVTGVRDLREYALVQGYLESLTFVSHVGVEALNGDTVRFRLTTRGGAESLQHALALNGRLQPIAAGDNGIQRFELRR